MEELPQENQSLQLYDDFLKNWYQIIGSSAADFWAQVRVFQKFRLGRFAIGPHQTAQAICLFAG